MNAAILLAGGTGSRINSDIPKQYITIGGRMVLAYAYHALQASSVIDGIWIVAEESRRAQISWELESHENVGKLMGFADPGSNRQRSIVNALKAMGTVNGENTSDSGSHSNNNSIETVLIHDAARPNTTTKLIDDMYAALKGHDGVMPVLPMKDTVYDSMDGVHVSHTLDRGRIYAGQAPELFLYDKYLKANLKLSDQQMDVICGASEPAVMVGLDIVMIAGDEANYKITTDHDMDRFRSMIERGAK